ncbi:casein kinase 2 regulatory subunit [Gonapodya sp. JEL0774]|nr:casein kinase 2 regulatory subunit [Gonapodya sp. JEL0774]
MSRLNRDREENNIRETHDRDEEAARNGDGDGEQDDLEDENDDVNDDDVQEDDQERHDFFIEVPEDFIEDDFNLCGLNAIVPHYNEALDMVLDLEVEDGSADGETDGRPPTPPTTILPDGSRSASMSPAPHPTNTAPSTSRPPTSAVDYSASLLYSLVHARYLLTKPGLATMAERYANGEFGTCPRVMCRGANVVPLGRNEAAGVEAVKTWCPRCGDVYTPKEAKYHTVDGASFGPTFPHLLFLTYPELVAPDSIVLPESSRRSSPALAGTVQVRAQGLTPSELSGHVQSVSVAPAAQGRSGRATSDSDSGAEAAQRSLSGPARRRSGQITSSVATASVITGGPNAGQTVTFAPATGDLFAYQPKVFGFRMSERARTGPRMGWLRYRPHLDETPPERQIPTTGNRNGFSGPVQGRRGQAVGRSTVRDVE